MACWLWKVPCAAKRASAARSPRPPATWASALVSHLTAREALADHLRILKHRREGAAIGGPPARRRGGKPDARSRAHHLRRPPRPSGSERRGARGRGSRWRGRRTRVGKRSICAWPRGQAPRARAVGVGEAPARRSSPACSGPRAASPRAPSRKSAAKGQAWLQLQFRGVTLLCQRPKRRRRVPPPSRRSLAIQKLRCARRALQRLKHVGHGLAWGVARRAVRAE